MSTKINARSPFFIESTEPTVSLGVFDCTTANLLNFAVSSDGLVTEPSILRGTIIDRTATSFASNTSGSPISRSVTYTIKIPDGYSNTSDGTISCVQTVDQPTQTTQCDPSTNNNMATFSGPIPDISNLTTSGATVNLATYFTAGSGSPISYQIAMYPSLSAISNTVVGDTLTFTTSTAGASINVKVIARNNVDSCITVSNSFSVSSAATKALDCTLEDSTHTAINATGGNIAATGEITLPSYNQVTTLLGVKDGSTVLSGPPYSINPNTSGSTISETLTFIFDIFDNYTNASSGTLECDITYNQEPTSAAKIDLECGDTSLSYSNFSISETGQINAGTVNYFGVTGVTPTNVRAVPDAYKFDPVAVNTARQIDVTFRVLNTHWLNYSESITCRIDLEQPQSSNPCVGVTDFYYISHQGFDTPNQFCDNNSTYDVLRQVHGTVAVGNTVCYLGNPLQDGDNKYYAYNTTETAPGAGNIPNPFGVIQISPSGQILRILTTDCRGTFGGDIGVQF